MVISSVANDTCLEGVLWRVFFASLLRTSAVSDAIGFIVVVIVAVVKEGLGIVCSFVLLPLSLSLGSLL